jgi:hypothetical protein
MEHIEELRAKCKWSDVHFLAHSMSDEAMITPLPTIRRSGLQNEPGAICGRVHDRPFSPLFVIPSGPIPTIRKLISTDGGHDESHRGVGGKFTIDLVMTR